jgi:hypothetical protein
VLPFAVCAPVQEPLAMQEAALVEDQVKVELCPSTMLVGDAVIDTVAAGAAGLTVNDTEPLALPPLPVQVRTK